jgi:hypothetical protein
MRKNGMVAAVSSQARRSTGGLEDPVTAHMFTLPECKQLPIIKIATAIGYNIKVYQGMPKAFFDLAFDQVLFNKLGYNRDDLIDNNRLVLCDTGEVVATTPAGIIKYIQ